MRSLDAGAGLLECTRRLGWALNTVTRDCPRQLVAWLRSKPKNLPAHYRRHRDDLVASCPAMTILVARVREFATILTQRRGTDLDAWITAVRSDDLPPCTSSPTDSTPTTPPSSPG